MENLSTLQTQLWLVLFINHTAMLVFSIIIMLAVSKGKLSRYGFKLAGNIQLKHVISWGLGLGIISTLIEAALPGKESIVWEELSFLQTVVFVWLYASICEEVFVRGLIQSSLSPLTQQFPLTRPPSHFLCVRVNNLSICLHLKPSFMVKGPPTHRFGARRSQNKGEKPPLALTPATQGYGYTAVAT